MATESMRQPVAVISDILHAYEADRLPVVVDPRRLTRAIALLDAAIGAREIRDQASVAAAVEHFGARRLAQGVSIQTVRREVITLKAAVRAAWKSGALAQLFHVKVPGPGAPRQRWLTEAEAHKLLARADGELRTFLVLALCTGARLGAMLELTWDRVDLRRGTIDFRTEGSPRRKTRAVVPIAPPLRAELERVRPRRAGRRRLLNRKEDSLRTQLHALAKACGIAPVTPHALRHTVATWLLSGPEVDLVTTSRLLGHRSTLITEQVYAHILPQHLQGATQALGRLLEPPARRAKAPHRSSPCSTSASSSSATDGSALPVPRNRAGCG